MSYKIKRLPYLGHIIGASVVSLIAVSAIDSPHISEVAVVGSALALIGAFVWQVWAVWGRLSDIDIPKWTILLFLLPFINLFFGLYLLFARGEHDQRSGATA